MSRADSAEKPRGREQVTAALLDAAMALFVERGPRLVSVREIARKANVNHGLVHRHFGSKEGLLRAVMQRLAGEVESALGPESSAETVGEVVARSITGSARQADHARILARALLDGMAPEEVQGNYPVVSRLLASARRRRQGQLSPEALVTLLVGTGLGLLLFKPYIRSALGLTEARWEEIVGEILGWAAKSASRPGQDPE